MVSMRFVIENRRNFVFQIDEHWKNCKIGEIEIKDGFIYFPKPAKASRHRGNDFRMFRTKQECEDWYQNEVDAMSGQFKKDISITTKAVDITDAEWSKMIGFMPNPDRFEREDFRVYEDWLAHNFKDRDGERFSKKVLMAFNRTLPGKGKMISHGWFGPGQGVYFDSRLEKMSIDETIDFVGPHPDKNFRSILEQVVEKDKAIHWLVGKFYIRADKTQLIDDIDDGSAKKSSIGFRADRPVEVKDDDDNVLWMEYEGNGAAEAIEGSIVGIESQYGARITKDFSDDEIEPKDIITVDEVIKPFANEHACRLKEPGQYESFARKNCYRKHEGKCIDYVFGIKGGKSEAQSLRYKKELWTASQAKAHCKDKGGKFEAAKDASDDKHKESGGLMDLEIKSLDLKIEVEDSEDSIKSFQNEVDSKIQPIIDENATLKEEADAVKKVAGDDPVAKFTEMKEATETATKESEDLRKDLIEETVALGCLAGVVDKEKADEKREFLKDLAVEKLLQVRDEYRKAVDEKFPRKGQLPTNTDDMNTDGDDTEVKELETVPESRYQTID
jgi:hypothetical protein